MNKRTIKVLGIIAVILIGAYAIAQISAASRTGKHLTELAGDDPDKVMDALAALRERGGAVGSRLAQLLQGGQGEAAPRAAWLLGMIGSHAGDQALIQALNSDKPVLRVAAMQALGQLRAAGAVAGLAAILGKTEEKSEMRVAAAYALCVIGGPKTLDPLVKALGERPQKEAAAPEPADAATAPAAGAAKPVAAITAAPAALPSAAPTPDATIPVRIAAARALGRLRDPGAIPALTAALSEVEPNPEVRTAAAYSLGDVTAAADKEDQVRDGVEALLKGLEDKTGDVRIAAAYALSKANPASDMKAEIAAALAKAEGDEHFWARQAAERSVSLLRLPE